MNIQRLNLKFLIILIFFIYLIFDFYIQNSKKNYQFELSWDEIDYVNAANQGILNNAFEFTSENLINFLIRGYNKIYKNEKISNINENEIKTYNYLSEDIFDLRHFHPPLLIYYLNFFLDENIKLQDIKVNFSFQLIGYILIISLFLLTINYKNTKLLNIIFLIIFLNIILNSQFFQTSIGRINFHLLFSLNLLFYCYSLSKFLKKQNNKKLIRISFFQSILFLSLETSFIIFTITLIIFIYYVYLKKINISQLLKFIIFSFLITIILWPANLYNFTILKTFLMYFYRIIFALESDYKNLSYLSTIWDIIESNFIYFLTIIIFLLLNFKKLLKAKFKYNIYLIYSLIYFVFIIPFTHNVTYVLPSLVLLSYYTMIVFINDKISLQKYLIIIFLFVIINYSKFSNIINYNINNLQIYTLINDIKSTNVDNPKILADGAHILEYYSNYKKIYNLHFYEKYKPKFYIEISNKYYDLTSLIKQSFFDIIYISKFRNFSLNDMDYLYSAGYIYMENNSYHIYYKNH